MIFSWFRKFPLFVLNSSQFMSEYFLVDKVSLNSLNSNSFAAIFTNFAVLDSLPSMFFMEYIFDFNPTDSQSFFLQTPLSFYQ